MAAFSYRWHISESYLVRSSKERSLFLVLLVLSSHLVGEFPFLISLWEIKFPEIKFVDSVSLKIQRVNEMRYYCFLLHLAVFYSLQALRWIACTGSGDISWTVLVFSQLALGKKARAMRNATSDRRGHVKLCLLNETPTVFHFTGSILALEFWEWQFNSI